ncbi:LapA family protein [Kitasatospora mediocidica]|uniref:hypothetical protein n=1 Tax=Kitasatospora mediocidica TaxID=58352 RepID=UPI0005621F8E|nr:hypothetical protein [Kitasatospora mediocidica]
MTEHSTQTPPRGKKWWRAGWFLPTVLAVLSVIFIVENRASTEIRLIIPTVTMPLWAALLGIWVVGALTGLFIARRRANRRTGQ